MRMTRRHYLIEAVVDGMWHFYCGRSKEGVTTWHTTDVNAKRFTVKAKAEREVRSLGGRAFIRQLEEQP